MLKRLYITLIFLSAFSVNSIGQNLNFEETVDYLNEKLLFFASDHASINATKQGDIDIYFDASGVNYRFNLCEVDFSESKNKKRIHMLHIQCIEKGCELVKLNRNELTTSIKFYNLLKMPITRGNQIPKIIKAFKHLKKICDPESDRF